MIQYFAELTGKKYVLLTSSCRAALYLAYKSLKKIETVITSPLTCAIALSPIIEAGKDLHYCDIDQHSFVMKTDLLPETAANDIAVQVIHLGGYPVDVKSIIKKGYFVVEDCAQALGSSLDHRSVGYWGDIACFSLTKTAYGIGGGILATNNEELYLSTKSEQESWSGFTRVKLLFRILRSWLESKKRNRIFRFTLATVLFLTKQRRAKGKNEFVESLKRASSYFFKLFYVQLEHLNEYHEIRMKNAREIIAGIDRKRLKGQSFPDSSGTRMVNGKLLFYSPFARADEMLLFLSNRSIESKHLEQSADSQVQLRFDKDLRFNKKIDKNNLENYLMVHDYLISLPLNENLTKKEIDRIVKAAIEIGNMQSSR
ncbi:MAG: DegT/DnrJ/EryC1/StrS family aminotransferase [Desulfobacterales bacterium]|nr:DegT/DnrJ/EryC1/StrS family aminotransferase [Desulfobacterales bacterium]